eukprot:1066063-Pleurochrysis_carterae.AAC.3
MRALPPARGSDTCCPGARARLMARCRAIRYARLMAWQENEISATYIVKCIIAQCDMRLQTRLERRFYASSTSLIHKSRCSQSTHHHEHHNEEVAG